MEKTENSETKIKCHSLIEHKLKKIEAIHNDLLGQQNQTLEMVKETYEVKIQDLVVEVVHNHKRKKKSFGTQTEG